MTDLAKAIAFATHCLKWTDVSTILTMQGRLVVDGGTNPSLNPDSAEDLEAVLTEFLGKRYFIQINRGTNSLFQWCVIVGLQDKSVKGSSVDNAQAEGDDLWDCVFDACVGAAGMFGQPA
jgi:hypothetical protein